MPENAESQDDDKEVNDEEKEESHAVENGEAKEQTETPTEVSSEQPRGLGQLY